MSIDNVIPAGIYLFQFNNRNTRIMWEICSKFTKRHYNDVIDVILVS